MHTFFILLFICGGAISILLFIDRATKKSNHQNLDSQISDTNSFGGSYVESQRPSSEVSVSESTKQITLADGHRPYCVSEISEFQPNASSPGRSSHVNYWIRITMKDGTSGRFSCRSLEDLLSKIDFFCKLSGRNLIEDLLEKAEAERNSEI